MPLLTLVACALASPQEPVALPLVVPPGVPHVRAIPGGLTVEGPVTVALGQPPQAWLDARSSEAFTLEAWVAPTRAESGAASPREGVARLVGYGTGARRRNVALDVTARGDSLELGWFVRTTATSDEGAPRFGATVSRASDAPVHVALVRSPQGDEALYVAGERVASASRAGSLEAWDATAAVSLCGEPDVHRPWLGEVYAVAFVARAMPEAEVRARVAAGPDRPVEGWLRVTPVDLRLDLAGAQLTGDVLVWLENPGLAPLSWEAELRDLPALVRIGGPASGTLAPGARAPLRLGARAGEAGHLPIGRHHGALGFAVGARATEGPVVQAASRFEHAVVFDCSSGRDLRPGLLDTGPRTPPSQHVAQGFTARAPGEVIADLHIHGPLLVDADDVTLRDLVIEGGDARFALRLAEGRTGLRIERVTVRGGHEATLCARSFTARDSRFEAGAGFGALLLGDCTLERSWIRPGAGTAPLVMLADEGRVRFFEVRLEATPESDAALVVRSERGVIRGVALERSWLGGGAYTLQVVDGGFGAPEAIALRDNTFLGGAREGAVLAASTAGWHGSGNRFAFSGLPLEL